jgi:hypothetical protein
MRPALGSAGIPIDNLVSVTETLDWFVRRAFEVDEPGVVTPRRRSAMAP